MKDIKSENQLIPIGEILRPRGLKGEVKVRALNGDPTRFFNVKTVFIYEKVVKINKCTSVGNNIFLFLEGVTSIELAEKLRGKFLSVPREELGEAEDGEYFVSDLIGASVESEIGEKLGTIISVDNYGAGDIIECVADNIICRGDILSSEINLHNANQTPKSRRGVRPRTPEKSSTQSFDNKPQTFRFVFLDNIVKEVDIKNKKFIVYKQKWQEVVVFD